MPFGLLAYNCQFFASDDASNLRASEDYKQWMESMCCYFGNAWASLFLGPMWSYETVEDTTDENASTDIVSEAIVGAFGQLAIPDCSEAGTGSEVCSSSHAVSSPSSNINSSSGVVSSPSNNVHSSSGVVSSPSNNVHSSSGVVSSPYSNVNSSSGVVSSPSSNVHSSSGVVSSPYSNVNSSSGVVSSPSSNVNSSSGVVSSPSSNVHSSSGVVSSPSSNVHSFSGTVSCQPSSDVNRLYGGGVSNRLWSGLSASELEDVEEAEVHHRDIAALHNVTPAQSRLQRSLKCSTLNVSFMAVLNCDLFFGIFISGKYYVSFFYRNYLTNVLLLIVTNFLAYIIIFIDDKV